jgi:hypothetical protein
MKTETISNVLLTVLITLFFVGLILFADKAWDKFFQKEVPKTEQPMLMIVTKDLNDFKNAIPNVSYFSVHCRDWKGFIDNCSCTLEVKFKEKGGAQFDGSGDTPKDACNSAIQGYKDFCDKGENK